MLKHSLFSRPILPAIMLMLLANGLYAQSWETPDSTMAAFKTFRTELMAYASQCDSSGTSSKKFDCRDYALVWVHQRNGTIDDLASRGDGTPSLCSDIDRYSKENEKSYESKEQYGLWHYSFTQIGDRYYVISANQAVSRVVSTNMYYKRKN